MNNVEKTLKLIEDSINKKCNGLECKVVKNNVDLRLENIQLKKQIDLMAEHIVSSSIVDDTVCAIKCDCESDISEDCSHEKMLNCTKEYFKRKATNIG